MLINKINYEQLFPLPQPYSNVRLSIEVILEEGDTTADAFTRGYKEANENFNRLFPQLTVNPEYAHHLTNANAEYHTGGRYPMPETIIEPKQSATERMIAAINQCTEIKVLETFKLLVKNNAELQDAYIKKMDELCK